MSSRGHGPKYTPGEEKEEMETEIKMMYGLYEELCKAYRKLAQEIESTPKGPLQNTTSSFGDWEKEKQQKLGDRYGN
jgi:hypothetical protein